MAGRNNHNLRVLRALDEARASALIQAQPNLPLRTADLLEDRFSEQHHEIQSLLVDNQRLAATYVALKQDVSASQQELRHLSATASAVKSESNAQVREVYENARRLEAEAQAVNGYADELTKVREDIQKLLDARKELKAQLVALDGDLVKAKSELQEFPVIKAEIEAMNKEIEMGRAAIENEKKMCATNIENSRIMEENMMSMASEIDKLKAELANAEKRARAAAAVTGAPPNSVSPAGYVMPDHKYSGHLSAASLIVPQVQSTGDSTPQYGHGTMPHNLHGHYEFENSNAHR